MFRLNVALVLDISMLSQFLEGKTSDAVKSWNATLIIAGVFQTRVGPTSPEVADWKRARWEVEPKLLHVLCMLLAVTHQSVSRPYHYSDCTQETLTIQIKRRGVQDIEERGSDVTDLFNRCRTLWAGSESILATWCERLLLEPVQRPSHLPLNTCNICTRQLFTYAPMLVLVASGFALLCSGSTETILQEKHIQRRGDTCTTCGKRARGRKLNIRTGQIAEKHEWNH